MHRYTQMSPTKVRKNIMFKYYIDNFKNINSNMKLLWT